MWFIILCCIQIYLDDSIIQCNNNYAKLLIIIHHVFNIYLVFGSILFKHYWLHLVVVILSLAVHVFYGKCPITEYSNYLSNQDKNVPMVTFLNHLLQIYNSKSIKKYYYTLIFLIILYDLYFIIKLKSLNE